MKNFLRFSLITTIILPFIAMAQNNNIDYDQIKMDENFRVGVMRFNAGYYSEAINAFQKAMSFKPDNIQVRTWLGKAYYFAGFEDSALQEWEKVIQKKGDEKEFYLERFVENIKAKNSIAPLVNEDNNFVLSLNIENNKRKGIIFKRPLNVYPDRNGDYYFTSFATNSILKLDQNGELVSEFKGVNTFKNLFNKKENNEMLAPFDLKIVKDKIYVSEFLGERISILDKKTGKRISSFGSKGSGDGQFFGPQYIASDGEFLYISDSGNQRVQKFDMQGQFILSLPNIKNPSENEFSGFKNPSGVEVLNDYVVVGDNSENGSFLRIFDKNGNYMGSSSTNNSEMLKEIENIKFLYGNKLLVTAKNDVFEYDIENDTIKNLFKTEDKTSKLTSATFDENGNLIVADFNKNKLSILSQMSLLYSGLQIEIQKIINSNFPEMQVEFVVKDPYGNPILGLKNKNFILSEGNGYLVNADLAYKGTDTTNGDIVIVLDTSASSFKKENLSIIQNAIENIKNEFAPTGKVFLIPILSAGGNVNFNLEEETIQSVMASAQQTANGDFSVAIRNAALELAKNVDSNKAVIFISDGQINDENFQTYGFAETYSFLKRKQISFYLVKVGANSISDKMQYLIENTSGYSQDLINPKGFKNLHEKVLEQKNSYYIMKYKSNMNSDFGRRYIPLKVEAYLNNRSGKDELGYFAPLNFDRKK